MDPKDEAGNPGEDGVVTELAAVDVAVREHTGLEQILRVTRVKMILNNRTFALT